MFSYFKITYTESLNTLSPTVLKNIDPSSWTCKKKVIFSVTRNLPPYSNF